MPIVIPSRFQIVDNEDKQATVSCAKSTTGNVILTIVTKNAYRAFLAFVGQAWDSVGEPQHVTWRVKRDGAVIYQLKDSTTQIAPPEQPSQELAPWIEVNQQCTITFEVDIDSTPATNVNVTARMRVYYVPVETNL